MTAIKTNDSVDVIVTRVRKSELDEENTLVLNPRNSLDPESSLKRDIDEYMRVMERQEQLLADGSRRSSIDRELAINHHHKGETNGIVDRKPKILEEDEELNDNKNHLDRFIFE